MHVHYVVIGEVSVSKCNINHGHINLEPSYNVTSRVVTHNPGSDCEPNLATTVQIVAERLTHMFNRFQLTQLFNSGND